MIDPQGQVAQTLMTDPGSASGTVIVHGNPTAARLTCTPVVSVSVSKWMKIRLGTPKSGEMDTCTVCAVPVSELTGSPLMTFKK